jgi:hypothetical protein
MSETNVRRSGFGEDGICLDAARNRYMGAISLGFGPDGKRIRRKVSGKTKREVRAKLQALHQELNSGVGSSSTYTVREAVDDWLREGPGRHVRADANPLRGPAWAGARRDRRQAAACPERGRCPVGSQ